VRSPACCGALRLRKALRAHQYLPRDNPTKLIAERGGPKIAAAIGAAFKQFRKRVPVRDIADAIRRRDYHRAADAIAVPALQAELRHGFAAIASVHKESAERGAKEISAVARSARDRGRLRKDTASSDQPLDEFAFDLYTDDVASTLRDYQDALISSLTDGERDNVFAAILAGVRAGETPDEIAIEIRDSVGLSDRQAQAVQNYRAMLEANDPDALGRALRDDTFDNAFQDALDSGLALSGEAIDDMVDAYVDRALDYRAQMIAQTESVRAANLGLHDAYQQATDRGVFQQGATMRFWLTSMDEAVCPICEGIPYANQDGVGLDDSFDSDDGPIEDPPQHPNCRCGVEYRTDLDMVNTGNA